MSNPSDMAIRRTQPVSSIGAAPQAASATGAQALRLGQTGAVDSFDGSKSASSIDPLGLQSYAENRQMRGLLKSNMSALRHRISMNIINNIGG